MLAIEEIQQLDASRLPLITVVTGQDAGQYSQVKEALLKKINYDPSDLGFSYFDLSETWFEEVANDLESLPFFADQKIIILDQLLDLTTEKRHYLDDQQLKDLEAYLESPLDTNRLIIFSPGKLDGKRRIVKLLKRDARVIVADEVKEAELRTYFTGELGRMGLQMEPAVFQALLEKSSFSFSEIQKNLAFLRSYKEDWQVSLEDIQEAIPKTLQDNIFELSQMILRSKVDPARQLVTDLRLQGEDEIKLIAILLNQFRTFLQVKILSQGRSSENQIVADLSRLLGRNVNPYQVRFAMRDARGLSVSYLQEVVRELIQTDFAIKTGQFEKEYLFDLLLLKLLYLQQ